MLTIIDPGHGGIEPVGLSSPIGVRGALGTLEKDLTLQLATRVADRLPTADVALTRTADVNLSLAERAGLARRRNADVFLSLHASAGPQGVRGAEAWVHQNAGRESHALAQALQWRFGVLGCGAALRVGELAVLSPERLALRTAGCLLEIGYLNDAESERWLRQAETIEAMAVAIANTLHAFALRDEERGPRYRSRGAVTMQPRQTASMVGALSDDDMDSLSSSDDEGFGPTPLARNSVVFIEVRDPNGAVTPYSHEYPVKPDPTAGEEGPGVQITLPDLPPLRARELHLTELRQQVAEGLMAARLFPTVNVNAQLASKTIAYEQPLSAGTVVYLRVLQHGGAVDPASGAYPVNDGGEIDVPKLGVVQAGGKTLGDLELTILKAIDDRRVFPGAVVDLALEELR